MAWIVRKVRIEDAGAVTDILNPIIKTGRYTVLDKTFSVEAEKEFITLFPERGIFHVAVDSAEQRLSGFQTVEPFATYTSVFDHVGIIGTYVGHFARRQGVAASLFEATFEAMKPKGFEKLFAYVRADNESALATYLKHGFRVIGTAEKHAKIRGAYIDEVLIEKLL